MNRRLSGELQALLKDQVRQDLAFLAENHAQLIKQDNLLRKTVLSNAGDAIRTQLHQQEVAAHSLPEPLLNTDYSIQKRVPEDIISDKQYTSVEIPKKGLVPTTSGYVSFSRFAFYLPAAVQKSSERTYALLQEARKISAVESLFSKFVTDKEQRVFRTHVVMAHGLYATLPGHADLPEGYDPRNTKWYKRALEADQEVWTSPFKDVVTGQLIGNLAMALRDESGNAFAVVAMDVLFEREYFQSILGHSWSQQAEVMLATPVRNAESGRRRLQIIARSIATEGGVWHVGDKGSVLSLGSPQYDEVLLEAIETVDVGTLVLPWKGKPYYWAWAPYKNTSWFMTLVPLSAVMELPNMVQQYQKLAAQEQSRLAILSIAGVLLVALIVAIVVSRMVTAPMKVMTLAAERLSHGDFTAQIDLKTGDERDAVIEAFNVVGPRLAEHLETQKTLAVAQEVQANFLPKEAPQLPGWDVSGASRYCEETGGDYYDFHDVPCESGKCLGVMVGDVSGHGIPSALLMTTARALLRGLAQDRSLTKAQRISKTNKLLTEDTFGTGRFMTLFAMELSSEDNQVRWVRAGHDPALCYCPEKKAFSELGGAGLPLGVLPDVQYEESHTAVAGGVVIFLGTDGVWEAERSVDSTWTDLDRNEEKRAGKNSKEDAPEVDVGAVENGAGLVLPDMCDDSSGKEVSDTSFGSGEYGAAVREESSRLLDADQAREHDVAKEQNSTSCRAEMYGKERLCRCIRRNAHKSAEEIRDAIIAEVEAWQGGSAGDDDITLVILKKTTDSTVQ